MLTSVIRRPAISASPWRYLSCLRGSEILVLQGSPLLGLAFALRHPALEQLRPLTVLVAANVLLIAHVFLLNDWSGLTADLTDPHKAAGVFTARGVSRREVGGLMVALLAMSLLLFSVLGAIPFALALAIAGLSALYSLPRFNWKGRPFLNSLAHVTGGGLHFLLGYSVAKSLDGRGLAMAAFFALTFAAGHLTQELRDYDGDDRNGIRTNAVTFGQRRTFWASLVLFTLSHALLFLLVLRGILPRPLVGLLALYPLHLIWSLRALAQGLTYDGIRRLQSRYRVLYAVIGLAMVVALGARG